MASAKRQRADRLADPERFKAYKDKQYAENGAAKKRAYRATAKGRRVSRVANRKWHEKNALYIRQRNHARKLKTPALTKKVTQELIDYYGEICVYCPAPATGFDHLQPVSREGVHAAENLAPCCGECNSRKGNRPIWTMVA